jgi:opacity protein-like surface antigen
MRQRKIKLLINSPALRRLQVIYSFLGLLMIFSCLFVEESRAADDTQPYNLLLGPVNVRADASLSTSFNDNVNLAQNGRLADLIIEPTVGVHALWQVTKLNALNFDIGFGYQWYAVHSQYDNFIIQPNSQLVFNLSIGDYDISLHNYFSYTQDPLLVGQVSNTGTFPLFTNVAGFEISRDLNDIIPSFTYDHTSQWVFANEFNYLDFQEDSITPEITVKVSKTINAGFNVTLSQTTYDKAVQNDNTSVSAGPFVKAQFSTNLAVNAQAGYIITNYSNGGSNGDNQNINSFYGSIGVTHQINDALTQSLTGGRDFLPGLTSNFTQRTYADYTIGCQATKYATLSANITLENLEDSQATFRETSNRFQTGLALDYILTPHANVNLSYQYTLKDSDVSFDSYYQNLVTAGVQYQF